MPRRRSAAIVSGSPWLSWKTTLSPVAYEVATTAAVWRAPVSMLVASCAKSICAWSVAACGLVSRRLVSSAPGIPMSSPR